MLLVGRYFAFTVSPGHGIMRLYPCFCGVAYGSKTATGIVVVKPRFGRDKQAQGDVFAAQLLQRAAEQMPHEPLVAFLWGCCHTGNVRTLKLLTPCRK